jgi:hypothetical protein
MAGTAINYTLSLHTYIHTYIHTHTVFTWRNWRSWTSQQPLHGWRNELWIFRIQNINVNQHSTPQRSITQQRPKKVALYHFHYFRTPNVYRQGTFFFHGATAPTHTGPGPPHYRGFPITLRHITLGRTPLAGCSARRKDLFLMTHETQKRQTTMHSTGFESTVPTRERP